MSTKAEVWAPWEPQIGDRVLTRLNGECLVPDRWGFGIAPRLGHHAVEDQLVGTVVTCPYIARDGFCAQASDGYGHSIAVRFDGPVEIEGELTGGGHFAAIELEPLEVRDDGR